MTTGAPMQPPPGGGYPPSTPAAAPKPADPAKSAAIMLVVAALLILIGTVSKNWITGGRGSRDFHVGPLGAEACFESRCVEIPNRGIPGDIEAIMAIAMISGFASAAAAGLFGGMSLAGKRDKIPVPPKLAHIAFGVAAFSMTFFVIRMISEKGELSWAGFPAIGGVILAGVGLKKLTPFLTQAQQAAFMTQPTQPSGNPQQSQPMHPQQSQPMQPHGQQPSQPYAQPQPMQPYGHQPSQPYAQPQPMQPYGHQPSQPYAQPQPMQPTGHQPQPYAQPSQPVQPQMAPPQHACPRCGTQLQFVAQYQRWYCPREQQYV